MNELCKMCKITIIVKTNYGPVIGILRKSILGDEFFSFKNIPYAQPPLGNLRFKDPQPMTPWQIPLDCTAIDAYHQHNQIYNNAIIEDCLYINVFTKVLKPKQPLPVMVWLYGGAFSKGSSSDNWYGPDYLLQKDIVFISFNYRLGAFGFLTIDDPKYKISGNAALKDQSMALRWVKENCSNFGGDPFNITVFGQSSGAACIHLHLMSELSKNLFQKAILMGGCAINDWAVKDRKVYIERLAIALGWNKKDGIDKAVSIFQNAKTEDIFNAQEMLISQMLEEKKILPIPFGPVIESYHSDQCFISSDVLKMNATAWGNNTVKIIIGGNADEGIVKYIHALKNPKVLQCFGNGEHNLPEDLDWTSAESQLHDNEKCLIYGKIMKRFYFGDSEPSHKTIKNYYDLMGDRIVWHGVHRTIRSRLKYSKSIETYLYYFNYDSPTFNHVRIGLCGKKLRGTCHGDELSYMFKNQFVTTISKDSEEFKIISIMINILTQFAFTGNPNNVMIKPIIWTPITDKNQPFKCLNISNELGIIDLPIADRMQFWDSFYGDDELY